MQSPVRIGTTHPRGGVLGLLPELKRDPLGLLERCARNYGDLVRIRLGLTPFVLINHPALVEEVLVSRQRDFRKNLSGRLGSALGNGLLVSEGEFWLRQRRLMQRAFHRQRVDAMLETMVSFTCQVLDEWRAGEVRDVYRELMDLTLQIAASTLLGTNVGADLERIRRSSDIMTEHYRSRLFTLMMLVPDGVPTPGNRAYAAAVRELDVLIYRLIAERRAALNTQEPAADLLNLLLTPGDATGEGRSDRQVRDEVITMMSAAYDTTALAVAWAWVLLDANPSARTRLYREVDAALDGGLPRTTDMSRLSYVEHVVAEALRLYPGAWVIRREAVYDTEIGGQRVAKGTNVLLSPWVLHRDARFFSEPLEFRPDRWSDGLAVSLPRCAYIPFGAGQRTCIGSGFAMAEATLILTLMAQRFHVELEDSSRAVKPVPVLTLQPGGRILARLAQR